MYILSPMHVRPVTLVERLKKNGVLPTAQRLRIAALLLASPQHLTAEQILCRLREGGMRISKATVYNTLNLFAAKGVIRQLAVDLAAIEGQVVAGFTQRHGRHLSGGEL